MFGPTPNAISNRILVLFVSMDMSETGVFQMASTLEKIKDLDEQRGKILAEAKKEALEMANAAIKALNDLGFNYQLALKGQGRPVASRKGTRTIKDAACGYCGFKTKPPHDKRAHRTQPRGKKKPFTDAELVKRGYKKI